MAIESSSFSKTFAVWRPAIFSIDGPTPYSEDSTCVLRRAQLCVFAALFAGAGVLTLTANPVATGIILTAVGISPYAYIIFESTRAVKAIAQRAFAAMKQGQPAHRIFQSLVQEPRVIERLLEQHPEFDFSKCRSDQGHNLLDTLLHKDGTQVDHSYRGWNLINALFDKYGLTSDDFLYCVKHSPELAIHLIHNKKIDLLALSPEQQFCCWENVTSDKLAQLMVDKGLDINLQNASGLTALELHLYRVATGKTQELIRWKILILLRANARIPNSEAVIAGKTVAEIVKLNSDIQQMFLQTGADNRPLTYNNESRLFSLEPAVILSNDQFRVNHEHVFVRAVLATVITSVALFALSLYAPMTAAGAAVLLLPCVIVKVYSRESAKAEEVLKQYALKELVRPFPRDRVYNYCLTRPDILSTLKAADFRKLSDRLDTMVGHCFNLWYQSVEFQNTSLRTILNRIRVDMSKGEWVEFILKNAMNQPMRNFDMFKEVLQDLTVDDFTPQQQHRLFVSMACAALSSAISWMVSQKFDINAKDEQGFTPLLRVFERKEAFHAYRLLLNGADRNATVTIDGKEVTVDTLAQGNEFAHQQLRTALEKHKQRK